METRRRRKRGIPIRDERGMALVVALWVMAMLYLLGILFLTASSTESTIASNEITTARAFHVADAGVEHARRALINLSPSAVLNGAPVFAGGNTANLAGGSYTVQVTNNLGASFPRGDIAADPSGDPNVDTDRILVLTSTGSVQGSQKIVEAIIQVPAPTSGAVYTMDGTDTPPSPVVEVEEIAPGASISGNDCNPPSAGGGPGPGPHVPGIAVQSVDALNDIVGDIGPNNPNVTGVGGDGSVQEVSDAMNDADFEVWVNTLIAAATPIGTGACGGTNPNEFGTWASPQICHVVGNTDVLIPTGSTGAGILVVQEVSPTADPHGATLRDFTYEGIVIVVGSGRLRLLGSSHIYGAVLQKNVAGNHSGETRLRLRDTSSICYSSLAVGAVQGAFTQSVMAWYEK